jgi:hypothetical protein
MAYDGLSGNSGEDMLLEKRPEAWHPSRPTAGLKWGQVHFSNNEMGTGTFFKRRKMSQSPFRDICGRAVFH